MLSIENLQYNCLDALMLNFNNHFLAIKQGCAMDLCYLHIVSAKPIRSFPES